MLENNAEIFVGIFLDFDFETFIAALDRQRHLLVGDGEAVGDIIRRRFSVYHRHHIAREYLDLLGDTPHDDIGDARQILLWHFRGHNKRLYHAVSTRSPIAIKCARSVANVHQDARGG
ncbi:MAG: hypothetical protein BWY76_02325 [bacterium ADurb.Bin429]|nr:MAG: hypothetical protein BWY76_02325 [bacterium ADurb.Bin429]